MLESSSRFVFCKVYNNLFPTFPSLPRSMLELQDAKTVILNYSSYAKVLLIPYFNYKPTQLLVGFLGFSFNPTDMAPILTLFSISKPLHNKPQECCWANPYDHLMLVKHMVNLSLVKIKNQHCLCKLKFPIHVRGPHLCCWWWKEEKSKT